MLVEPVATTVAGAVVIAWLVVQAGPAVGDGVLVLWWLWLILAARLVWKVFEWRNEWFVATDKRLLLLYGLITHKVAMMPLTKVTDMNYGRSLVGRVLGYGQFLLESAGQDQALRQIDWVARPDRTYRLLCDTLFIPGARPGGAPVGPGGAAATTAAPLPATVPPPAPRPPQPAEPPPVEPAPAWDGHSRAATTPPPPAPLPTDPRVVVVPGRSAGVSSGPTQPIPATGDAHAGQVAPRPDGGPAAPTRASRAGPCPGSTARRTSPSRRHARRRRPSRSRTSPARGATAHPDPARTSSATGLSTGTGGPATCVTPGGPGRGAAITRRSNKRLKKRRRPGHRDGDRAFFCTPTGFEPVLPP